MQADDNKAPITKEPQPAPAYTAADEKKASRNIMITMGVVTVAVAVVAVIGFLCLNRPEEYVEGQVEGTTVRVSGKMAGRIAEFYVQEGDTVHAGDTLVHIHSAIADAQLASAEAMREVAEAQNRKVDAGTRKQIIASAADLVKQAEAAADITRKTYERMNNLYKQGVISEQRRDEAKAAYDAAKAQLSVAQQQHSLAVSGAQNEDKQAAEALVRAASGPVEQAKAVTEDSYLIAPCDGTIDERYPEEGELVAMGAPIFSILRDNRWVTFNVREELLPDFEQGKKVKVMIPALKEKDIEVQVYYVRDMGSYATWRATKSTGQYDSRTFQIKARPVSEKDAKGLRPGMSAIHKK
ncbi:MAG: HlyD family secretion protein [Muribaculaceae bacterium]